MGKRHRIITANDNSPRHEAYTASALKHAIATKPNASDTSYPTTFIFDKDSNERASEPKNTSGFKGRSLKLSIILWLTAVMMGLSNFVMATTTELKAISTLAVLWAGLWTSYVAADYKRWRLSELAIVSALGGLMGAITLAANYFGLNLTLVDGLILMSILSLAMGHALKSRIAILASISASLLWAIISFLGLAPINNLMVLFPLLGLGQIYCGSKINSGLAIGLAVGTLYYSLIGLLTTLWANDLISLPYASSLLFIIAVAHHRSGKAAEDSKIIGSNIHIYAGWLVAVISAALFQYFWLSPDAMPLVTETLSPIAMEAWKMSVGLSILAIFVSGIIRFKHTQITLPGIFLLTLCSALIPLMMWFPQWPETLAAGIPGIEAVPAFGLVIGAGIIAAAFGIAINGVRRKSSLMIAFGLTTLLVETYFLMRPSLFTLDNMIIFFAALLVSLAVGGAIAGNSLAFQAPAPRLKHS